MSDRKNIKVYEDTYSDLKERKERGQSMDNLISELLEEGTDDILMNRIDDLETEMKAQFEGLR